MQTRCEVKDLRAALVTASRASSKGKSLPVLVNVMLTACAARLKLACTDLERFAVVSVEAETLDAKGDTSEGWVSIKLLRGALKGKRGAVTFDFSKGKLTLSFGASKVTLPLGPAEDFPDVPETPTTCESVTAEADEVRDLLAPVAHSMSQDVTRYNLNGVNFEKDNASGLGRPATVAVTTDGHRLTHNRTGFVWPMLAKASSVIIPAPFIADLVRLVGAKRRACDEVTLSTWVAEHGNLFTSARFGDTWLCTRPVEGEFPSWRQVLPEEGAKYKLTLQVKRDEMLAGLATAETVVAGTRGRGVKVTFGGKSLTILGSSSEHGESEAEVDVHFVDDAAAKGKKGKTEVSVGFNAIYLREALEALPDDAEDVLLQFTNDEGNAPVVLRAVVHTLPRMAVMPFRL